MDGLDLGDQINKATLKKPVVYHKAAWDASYSAMDISTEGAEEEMQLIALTDIDMHEFAFVDINNDGQTDLVVLEYENTTCIPTHNWANAYGRTCSDYRCLALPSIAAGLFAGTISATLKPGLLCAALLCFSGATRTHLR